METVYLTKDGIAPDCNPQCGKCGPLGSAFYVCWSTGHCDVKSEKPWSEIRLKRIEGDGRVLAVSRLDANRFFRTDPYEDHRIEWTSLIEQGWKLVMPEPA